MVLLQVLSVLDMGGGMTFVQMREVVPKDQIMSFDLNAPSEVKRPAPVHLHSCSVPTIVPSPLLFRLHYRFPYAANCAEGRTAASSAAIITAAVRRANERLVTVHIAAVHWMSRPAG